MNLATAIQHYPSGQSTWKGWMNLKTIASCNQFWALLLQFSHFCAASFQKKCKTAQIETWRQLQWQLPLGYIINVGQLSCMYQWYNATWEFSYSYIIDKRFSKSGIRPHIQLPIANPWTFVLRDVLLIVYWLIIVSGEVVPPPTFARCRQPHASLRKFSFMLCEYGTRFKSLFKRGTSVYGLGQDAMCSLFYLGAMRS